MKIDEFEGKKDKITEGGVVYSLGMIFYEILIVYIPYEEVSEEELIDKIKGNGENMLGCKVMSSVGKMIEKCLSKEPINRPYVDELKESLLEVLNESK